MSNENEEKPEATDTMLEIQDSYLNQKSEIIEIKEEE